MTRSIFQQAYEAFHRRLPDLLRQGLHGHWVLFHGDKLVETSESRDRLYQLAEENKVPEDEIFVDLIAPELEDIDAESSLYR